VKNPFRRKEEKKLDLTGRTPVIRCSICTGEETAGFRDNETGVFTEVMKLSSDRDYEEFFRMCGTEDVERIY
jgi:hypothetical protein